MVNIILFKNIKKVHLTLSELSFTDFTGDPLVCGWAGAQALSVQENHCASISTRMAFSHIEFIDIVFNSSFQVLSLYVWIFYFQRNQIIYRDEL